ncbi:MAG: DUF1007 family protein [Pseudomonadota bacterium]
MRRHLAGFALLAALLPGLGAAHPHVYVDGGVSFILDAEKALTALEVTWRYDPFETLYTLSALQIVPQPDGTLTETDRGRIAAYMSDWPPSFSGSAHLTMDGAPVALDRPTGMEVALEDGNLVMTFRRALPDPLPMAGAEAEVATYEATYFFAFSVTELPKIHGAETACTAEVIPFDPTADLETVQVTLFALGREETPEVPDVGALFADRTILSCA